MIQAIQPILPKKPWKTYLLNELDSLLAADLPVNYHCALAWIRDRLGRKKK